jgi:phage-related tail fiber protein
VPLSEREQRLLEQMERALHAEDPKFASALQGDRLRKRMRRRVFAALVGVLAGAALTVYGIVSRRVALDVAGGAVAVACAWLAWTTWRRVPAPGQIVPAIRLKPRGTARGAGTLAQRMELRWQRRRERDGF